jgi:hypothetical protein
VTQKQGFQDTVVAKLLKDKSLKKQAKQILSDMSKEDVIDLFLEIMHKETESDSEVKIPLSLFSCTDLSALELICTYLKEEEELKNKEIAQILSRSQQVIWTTYSNARKKCRKKLSISYSDNDIPLSFFQEHAQEYSILESIVVFLKEKRRLRYRDIGKLLYRNERTIWTVYSRAKKR